MKYLPGIILILTVAVVLIIAAISVVYTIMPAAEDVKTNETLPESLVFITENTEKEISGIYGNTKIASEKISGGDFKATDEALLEAYLNSSYTVSYGFMSSDGVLMAVAPEEYSDSKGLNIGSLEPAKTILSKREPYMTTAFTAIEGFYAIELSYPVFSSDGEYKGAVLCMAEPYRLLSDIISPVENETGASITVMQTDGLILYDRDIKQAGKNLFTDPVFTQYKSLINLGHTICSKKTGYGTYTFYESGADSSKSVKKQAYWDTVENYGQEWRIIFFKPVVMCV